jgi:hypothetical protein
MKMVPYQTIGMHLPTRALSHLPQRP